MTKGTTIHVLGVLPSSSQWGPCFAIEGSGGNAYTVAQKHKTHAWGCSCPGYRFRRECKHLRGLGLPVHDAPYDLPKTHLLRNIEQVHQQSFGSKLRSQDQVAAIEAEYNKPDAAPPTPKLLRSIVFLDGE